MSNQEQGADILHEGAKLSLVMARAGYSGNTDSGCPITCTDIDVGQEHQF